MSCHRTPKSGDMSPHSIFQKSSGTVRRSVLKLFTVATSAGEALRTNHDAEHHCVVLCQWHDAVQRRVAMHIMQPCQIRFLKRDPAVPELKPHFPSRCVVPQVNLFGGLHMEFADEFSQAGRFGRRDGHEMIMIGQYRPGAQFPAEFSGAGEQGFKEEIQPFGCVQVREFFMGTAGNHVETRFKQPMGGRVRPVHKLTSVFGVRGYVRASVQRDMSRRGKRRRGTALQSSVFREEIFQIRRGEAAGEAFFAQHVGNRLCFALLQFPDFFLHRAG